VARTPLLSSFTIQIDRQEKLPYAFAVVTPAAGWSFDTEPASLETGDYQDAYPPEVPPAGRVVVERKTLHDLYSTLGGHRERFEAEFQRMSEYGFAALVIEADLAQVASPHFWLTHKSLLNPRSVVATLLAWSQRYGVHVLYAPGRRVAEQLTYRILERWARDHA